MSTEKNTAFSTVSRGILPVVAVETLSVALRAFQIGYCVERGARNIPSLDPNLLHSPTVTRPSASIWMP